MTKFQNIVLRTLFLITTVIITVQVNAQESFLSPPETTGSIKVKLYPTENVAAGSPVLVTFGMPFTKSSITEAELTSVKVKSGDQEIPVYVEMLSPWRPDNNSVRIARIQLEYTFSVIYPAYEEIILEWGGAGRVSNKPTFEDPRSAWHLVNSGSFVAADGVYEPDVYAVFPKDYMAKGVLKLTRMNPVHDDILETRDDPYDLDYTLMDSGRVHESAGKNFFYTIINEDTDLSLLAADEICNYKTESEPWLFDRSAAMYVNYFRNGHFKMLREAVRASQFYASKVYTADFNGCTACTGMFSLKMTDPMTIYPGGNMAMYSYTENLAYTYWLTGDDEWLQTMRDAVTAYSKSENTRWSPNASVWTERHTGLELLATIIAYEVFGESQYWDRSLEIIGDFIWHQKGADGQIPADRIDGGLYHKGSQHAWDWDENAWGISPWMSSFIVEPMVRAYAHTEADSIAGFIVKMGNALAESCIQTSIMDGEYPDAGTIECPVYTMGINGGVAQGGENNEYGFIEHAPDVGISIAWALYFSQILGENMPVLKEKAESMFKTYEITVDYWTRPAGPDYQKTQYRVAPWRKYSWQQRITGSYPWLLYSNTYELNYIEEDTEDSFNLKLFPNPVRDFVMVGLPETSKEVKIRIISTTGQVIKEINCRGMQTLPLSTKDIQAGVYFAQVEWGNESVSEKFIKLE